MTKDTNFTKEFHLYSQLPVNSNLLGKSKEVQVIGSSKQITSNKETSILQVTRWFCNDFNFSDFRTLLVCLFLFMVVFLYSL